MTYSKGPSWAKDILWVLILKGVLLVGLFRVNFTHPVDHTPNSVEQHLFTDNSGDSR